MIVAPLQFINLFFPYYCWNFSPGPPSGCVPLPGSYPPSQSPQLPPIFNLKISVFIPFNPGRPFSYLLSFRSHKAIFAVLGFLKTDIGGSSAGGRVCLCVHNFLSFFSSVPVSYPIPSSLFVRFGEAPRKALPHLGPWPFGLLLLLLSVSRLQTRHNIKALLQTFKRPLLIGELSKLLKWIKSKKMSVYDSFIPSSQIRNFMNTMAVKIGQ